MTKTVCDKCGKVISTDKSLSTTEWTIVELYLVQGGEKYGSYNSFDLCDECKDALVAFIEGEEEQNHD